jgi:hypothetical protein
VDEYDDLMTTCLYILVDRTDDSTSDFNFLYSMLQALQASATNTGESSLLLPQDIPYIPPLGEIIMFLPSFQKCQ